MKDYGMATRRKKELSGRDYLWYRRKLDREWGYFLELAEFRVLSWLMAATVGWGNRRGWYSLGQMLNGIPDQKGGWHILGVRMSSSTLRRALDGLKKKAVLNAQRRGRDRTQYTINLDWQPTAPDAVNKKESLQSVRPPTGEHDAGNVCAKLTPSMLNLSGQDAENEHGIYKGVRTRKRTVQATHSQTPSGAGYYASGVTNPEATQQVSEPPAPAYDPLDPIVHWNVWSRAWRETWPEAISGPVRWSGRENATLKGLASRWPENAHGKFSAFLDWAVRNWNRVRTTNFAWMTDRPSPQFPDLIFLTRFINEFAAAYCERELHEFLATQPEEQRFYHQLKLAGKSHDEAVLEIATRLALAADREKRQQDLKEAARLYRMADLIRKQAEQRPRFTKDNPHPDALPYRPKGAPPLPDQFDAPYAAPPMLAPWDMK
jgi:hypothetical protein